MRLILLSIALATPGSLFAGEPPADPGRAPRPADFRFVHLSDTHCAHATRNPRPRFLFDPSHKDLVRSFLLLEGAVRLINDEVRPDFVVVTGDLVDRPNDARSLARAKGILDRLKPPYHVVIGNHDGRTAWDAVFGTERLRYVFRYRGWRFVALDSSRGRVAAADLAWLRTQLEAEADRRAAVLLHHPLVLPPAQKAALRAVYGASLTLRNSPEVLRLLEGQRRVRLVLAGHGHLFARAERAGITHLMAPSLIAAGNGFTVVEVRGDEIHTSLRHVRLAPAAAKAGD